MRLPMLPLLVVAGLLNASSLSAQVIKLGTVAPEGSPWHLMVKQIGESWSKTSGGKIQLPKIISART